MGFGNPPGPQAGGSNLDPQGSHGFHQTDSIRLIRLQVRVGIPVLNSES